MTHSTSQKTAPSLFAADLISTQPSTTANNTYNGKFTVDVNANNTKENYIVLTFANTSGKTLNTKVSVNGADAFGVPFYKTGTTAKEAANTVYIPVLAKGESNFTVEFTFDGKLSVYSAKLVEKMY